MNKNPWKKLFFKYFDINKNKKIDWIEILFIILFILSIIIFELSIQIGGSYIYDKFFNKNIITTSESIKK